jgi:hypothetical protein
LHTKTVISVRTGNITEAVEHLAESHSILRQLVVKGVQLDATAATAFALLEDDARDNYSSWIKVFSEPQEKHSIEYTKRMTEGMAEFWALGKRVADAITDLGAVGASAAVTTVHIPDPLAQPRRELSSEELRESADRCFQKGLWEAASGLLEQLLARGEPLPAVAPKLITCLVSAHEDLVPTDAARIEDLLRQLEAAGHATLAIQLRQQHASKLIPPKKPWWKVW